MKFLPKLYLFLFSAFCFTIPFNDFGEAIPNILLGTTGLFFFFVIKKAHFRKLQNSSFYVFLAMIILISIQSVFLKRWEDFEMISRLLIVPAMLILHLPLKNLKIPMYAFLVGALTLVIMASLNIGRIYFQEGTFDFTGELVNKIILGERPYLGFMSVIGFCLSVYFGINNLKNKIKQSFLFFILAILFLGFIFIISARISLLSIVLIAFFYLITLKNKVFRYGLLIGTVLVFCGIFMVNKNLKKRFFITENTYTIEEMLKFEPRYYIWNCAASLTQDKPFIGWGFVNGQDNLKLCFSKSGSFLNKEQQDYFVRSRFNTHNQFLNFFISNGIICLLLFILFFIIILFKNRNNYFIISLLISLFLFCLVENVLSRQVGAMLFGLVYVFTFLKKVNYLAMINNDVEDY